ncbi:hypothetical protein J1605_008335 [Eschrichtius robustus]|uniref:Uncharacterized protein n=1 Tax=Eschrichtius robustus TaxID=9764 RepID=A0AB34H0C3_ESCRO|nr:hypothetical protein J1605_008335 [Eschrichtius robustus]
MEGGTSKENERIADWIPEEHWENGRDSNTDPSFETDRCRFFVMAGMSGVNTAGKDGEVCLCNTFSDVFIQIKLSDASIDRGEPVRAPQARLEGGQFGTFSAVQFENRYLCLHPDLSS